MTSTTLQTIPLNMLIVSTVNVRKTDRKADVSALAASINSHGLLQNLAVAATEGGKFSVVAGGRRLAALKMLAKNGAIAKNFPVPCQVVGEDHAAETSLAENIHRVAMDPLDECEAFDVLRMQGLKSDDIARRFGVTIRHVEQRLALANLSPRLKAAWKRKDLSLDAARAFCLVSDHTRQEAVFKSMGKPVTHAGSVRARLMEGQMRASDRLVRFAGLDAYEAAGGAVRRDLFDSESVFIENPALVAELAAAKIATAAAEWAGRGWGWIETSLDNGRPEGMSPTRLQPEWRDPTDDESVKMQQLQEQIDTLDTTLEASSTDDDPRWTDRDDLEAAYETIRQAARTWNPDLINHAGVLLSVDHGGALLATEGLIRKEDQKHFESTRRGEVDEDDDAAQTPEGSKAVSSLPKALAREITSMRTSVIRTAIAGAPDIALAVSVAALALRLMHRTGLAGININGSDSFGTSGAEAGLESLACIRAVEPSDILAWCLAQDASVLLPVFARLISRNIDLVHDDATPFDNGRQVIADTLAASLSLDMTAHWSPDLDFWLRLSKTTLLEEYERSPVLQKLSPRSRTDKLATAAKLKKAALAERVHDAWRGGGYLPEVLITPVAAGALTLCEVPQIAAE